MDARTSASSREEAVQAAKSAGFAGEGSNSNVPLCRITGERNAKRCITSESIGVNSALHLSNLHGCSFELDEDVHKLAKVFIEQCSDCDITLHVGIVSSFVEIWRSFNCIIRFAGSVRTVQLDLCDGVQLAYDQDSSFGALVHAASCNTLLHLGNSSRRLLSSADTSKEHAYTGSVRVADSDGPQEEQKITRMLQTHDIVTEDLIRGTDEYPTTARENPHIVDDPWARADSRKQQGNESFKLSDFSQAVAHYTAAIQAISRGDGESAPVASDSSLDADKARLLATIYANRSACFLKLGEHSRALADAKSATKHDPSYVKGHFRHGMSLHALGRYNEAVPCYLKALEIAPNNKHAKEGLSMSRMMHRRKGSLNPDFDCAAS